MINTKLNSILANTDFSKSEIVYLLSLNNESEIAELYKRADEVRKEYCGDEVHLRGIIEFSNYCEADCLYCGLRKSNDVIDRYRMTKAELLETAGLIAKANIKTIVLQSGEDSVITKDFVTEIIKSIKEKYDIAITLSLGERDFRDYVEWRAAGADRYLLKHETANPKIYYTIHNKQNLEERLSHLRYLKSIGFQAGSGNIIGLPSQTLEDIADDILLCKNLISDMCSFSPFIPSHDTPFNNVPLANLELTLKTMAVARIVLKNPHIPATTALSTLSGEGRKLGLTVGANVIMPNFTPDEYKDKYKIYANKKTYNPFKFVEELKTMINQMGRSISEKHGHSLKLVKDKID